MSLAVSPRWLPRIKFLRKWRSNEISCLLLNTVKIQKYCVSSEIKILWPNLRIFLKFHDNSFIIAIQFRYFNLYLGSNSRSETEDWPARKRFYDTYWFSTLSILATFPAVKFRWLKLVQNNIYWWQNNTKEKLKKFIDRNQWYSW